MIRPVLSSSIVLATFSLSLITIAQANRGAEAFTERQSRRVQPKDQTLKEKEEAKEISQRKRNGSTASVTTVPVVQSGTDYPTKITP